MFKVNNKDTRTTPWRLKMNMNTTKINQGLEIDTNILDIKSILV